MKLIHAIFMCLVCAFIFNMVRLNQVLTRKQYSQILILTCLISLLYFAPCVFIAKITFEQQRLTRQGGQIFIDWVSMLFTTSEKNWYGLVLSVLIHAQIYAGIFALQFFTMSIKQTI